MENKAKYTVVGIFVLVFTIAMVIFILWLARYDVKEILAKEYRIYSKTSVAGLHENSIVEYKGLNIGTIHEIRINPKNLEEIEIILKITKPEVIKTNSFAIIQSQGVTGNKIIEIDGGTKDAEQLLPKENSFVILPLKKSFFDKLTNSAENISGQIETVLKRFEKILNDKNITNIESTIKNINESSKSFNELLTNLNSLTKDNINKTLSNINNAAISIDNVVKNDISQTTKNVNNLTQDLNHLTNEIRIILKNDVKVIIDDFKDTAKSSSDIEKVINEFEQTLIKIDNTLDELNQNGGNMLFNTREIKYGPGEMK